MANRLSKTIAILLRIAFGFAISLLVIRYVSQHAHAAEFEGLQVEVIGQGRPVLMIPGLNSAGSVWTETCAALQPQVQCHIVQLPGFAGLAPVSADPWLPAMRDRLLRYSAQLKSPSIVGHSLGGVLGLQLVLAEPGRFERLVIVDSLPFFPAIQNPAATAEGMRPMADGMRAGMLASAEANLDVYRQQAHMALGNMSNQPERMATLVQWSDSSDPATTAAAMHDMMTTDLREASRASLDMFDVEIRLLDRPGELARMGEAVAAVGISVEGGGAWVVDGVGVGHFLFADGEAAGEALRRAGLEVVAVRPVIVLRLDQARPGQLGALCRRLSNAGVNLQVQYSDHHNQLVLVTDQPSAAAAVAAGWLKDG
ncbi:MAG: alpha/beta hydrolase [Xanthomonadales bacterium]|nr:alpha/beta hydrolase [Xanthomonadales bacterium]